MTHFIPADHESETFAPSIHSPSHRAASRRRLAFVFAALVAALVAVAPRPADADPAVDEQVISVLVNQAVKDHAAECPWVLGSETVAGTDLPTKGYRFEIVAMIWDGQRAEFYLDLTVPKKGSGGAETVPKWRYPGHWNVAKVGHTWKVTDKPGTIVAQRPKPSRPLSRILRLPF